MAVIDYTADIQKLYVAYFNRPADYEGLAFWNTVLNNGSSLEFVSSTFAKSPEYAEQNVGKSYFQIVNQIYLNLFNREADVTGMEFWADRLKEGTFTVDQIVKVIADNASDTDAKDKTTYANKVAAATAFTAELNTASEIIGYSGAAANAAAKNWLSTVGGTTESLNAAIAPAALAATVAAVSNTGLATGGTTQNLTTGLDTLVGTSGNDTFVGVVGPAATGTTPATTTLTALDSITGGAGVDTLQINALEALNGIPSIAVSGVEVVNVRGASSVNADVSTWTGVEQFNITEANGAVTARAGATTNISASVKASTTAGAGNAITVNGGKDVVVRVTDNAVETQDVFVGTTAAGTGGTSAKGTVSVESTGIAAVASATAVNLGDITVKGGTTINVTQNATSSTAGLTVGTVTHNQGDISITGDASTTTVNVKQTAAATAVAGVATVAGVTETASVKFTALTAGQSFTVAGLTFTASKALTAAQVATAFANLVEGILPVEGDTQGSGVAANGIYSNKFTGWTSGAANGDTVVFTSTAAGDVGNLTVTAGATGSGVVAPTAPTPVTTTGVAAAGKAAVAGVNAGIVTVNDAASTIKTVTVDAYGNGSAITGTSTVLETLNLSNSNGSFTVADSAATLALNLNKVGTSTATAAISITTAPTTLNVKSTGANVTSLTSNTTETLNVSGTGTLTTGSAGLGGLKTIVVTETAGLNSGADVLANVTSVTTTGTTGSVTVAIDGGKATYAGGAGVDSVTIGAATTAITKAINLGAGDDRLNLSNLDATKLAATGATVVLEGGEGTDTIALAAAAAATASQTAGFEARFNGFERLEVGQLMSSQTINLDNLDDINYVITKGNVATGGATVTTTQGVAGVTAVTAATEASTVTFADLAANETVIVAGRTVTAGASGATAAEVAAAFATGNSSANAVISGDATGYGAAAGAEADEVVFTSTTPNFNVTPNLTVGGTGTGSTVSTVEGAAPVTGVTAVTESNIVVFNAMVAGQTVTVGGRTVTATGAATAAEVAAAFVSGNNAGNLTVGGTLGNWSVTNNADTTTTADVIFTSTVAGNVTDLAATGTGATTGTTLTLDKMLSNATVQLDAAGSVIVKLADATGTADIVNLITNATSSTTTLGTVTVAGVETINVTANDTTSGTGVSSNTFTLAADAATTVNVGGAGNLELVLGAATKAVTAINGSTATGDLEIASSSEADAVAVTITGGAGNDVLTASGNKADVLIGGAGDDTLVSGKGLATLTGGAGNDLFQVGTASANVNSYATITDFAAGDLLQFVGVNSFSAARVALGETAVFQDYANAAVNALNVGQMGWFVFGGNTYVVADLGADSTATAGATTTGFSNGEDFIVKLTGTVDLTNASFNATYGTIGLV